MSRGSCAVLNAGPSARRCESGSADAKSREARPAADGRAPAAVPEAAPVSLNTTSSCPHPVAQDLSFGGSARFHRCSFCGTVLISHEGRWWSLQPCEFPIPEELIRG